MESSEELSSGGKQASPALQFGSSVHAHVPVTALLHTRPTMLLERHSSEWIAPGRSQNWGTSSCKRRISPGFTALALHVVGTDITGAMKFE